MEKYTFFLLAHQVSARHALLRKVTGTKPEEDLSYHNMLTFQTVGTSLLVFASVMEVLVFFVYNNKVLSLNLNNFYF